MDSREALIRAINDFEGAVILVAHDRHIVETCADRLLLVADKTIKSFDGDLDDYAQLVLSQRRKQQSGNTGEQQSTPRQPSRPAKQLNKQLADLDARMQKTHEKLAVLDRALADHTIYREEPLKAADFAKLRTKLANDLARDEELWLNLQEEIANA
jgi:ATP-binding cassette subfamily F protein 3